MHNYCKGNWPLPPKILAYSFKNALEILLSLVNRLGITGVKTSGDDICESVRSLALDQSSEDLSLDAAGFNQVVKMH